MISIWVFLVCLAIPVLIGYDIVKVSTDWLESRYKITIRERKEGN